MTAETHTDGNGARDKAYNLVWYVEECLKHTERLHSFAADAERDGDKELAAFFTRAHDSAQKVGAEAKHLLGKRLVAA